MTDAENSTATTAENDKPTGGGASGGATPEPKFTQDDVNRLTGDARKEGRSKALADFLKDLGVEKPEDAKSLIAAAKAKADAEKTDAQKATEAADREKTRREEVEARLAAVELERRLEKRDAKIAAAAKEAGVTSPELFMAWAEKFGGDSLKATMADDGALDDKAVKALVEAARKAQPALFKPPPPGSPSFAGGRAPTPGKAERDRGTATNQRIIRG